MVIPFSVVRRRPYTVGVCSKGEWPGQRFVAIEDGEVGLALINDVVPGVETLGGSVYITILHTPVQAYAGMVSDESSSQHSEHDFSFAIAVYTGEWSSSDVLCMGQRWNTPLCVSPRRMLYKRPPCLRLTIPPIMLSAVKEAIDDEKVVLLCLTESIGCAQRCCDHISGVVRAYPANMLEEKL